MPLVIFCNRHYWSMLWNYAKKQVITYICMKYASTGIVVLHVGPITSCHLNRHFKLYFFYKLAYSPALGRLFTSCRLNRNFKLHFLKICRNIVLFSLVPWKFIRMYKMQLKLWPKLKKINLNSDLFVKN